jgi:hypothetical protein
MYAENSPTCIPYCTIFFNNSTEVYSNMFQISITRRAGRCDRYIQQALQSSNSMESHMQNWN